MGKHDIGKIRFLSVEDMQNIHQQALVILKRTGVEIDDDAALIMLADAGAEVDRRTRIVRFPAEMVEQSLTTVPREITLAGRNPERDLVLRPEGTMHTRNTGGMAYIRDLKTGVVRDATLDDVADFTRLMDGLDNIGFIAPLYAEDVSPDTRELWVLSKMMENTDKHINIRAFYKNNLRNLLKMGEVVAGGKEQLKKRPVISMLESPISPLKFPDVFVEALLVCGEYGIPFEICPAPNLGATGPITLAGALLLVTVENLAATAVSQVANPGAPLIWAPRFLMMDMSTGLTGLLADGVIVSAAAAQLAIEHYNFICDLYGPITNSVIADGESIFEESFCAYVTAFAGRPSVLCGAGVLELGLVASFEEMVITNEILGVLRRILEGMVLNDDRLGADAISRVGIGGNYLTDGHTVEFLRSERYDSPFVKPKTRDSWIADGSKSFVEKARERALEILKEHQPVALDETLAKGIREIINEAESKIGNSSR